MKREEPGPRLHQAAHLHGHFVLRSGQVSGQYFDKYRSESDPSLLAEVAAHLAPLLDPQVEVLAGLELGGIPIATALALRTGLAAAFVRKKAKEHGTRKRAEGVEIAGKQLLIVEDVVSWLLSGFISVMRHMIQPEPGFMSRLSASCAKPVGY